MKTINLSFLDGLKVMDESHLTRLFSELLYCPPRQRYKSESMMGTMSSLKGKSSPSTSEN
ncbi:hypothetical protein D1868_10720 [Stygiolobus azoricus]|uniref:Uncharacterized protein n=1 Tax=Stygiolobus azoricus TaxID=41675 RepID=A0A650CRF6_9CREN|nr:hypothetical protein D1868_10720 [Stygiolobus azoricus]